MSEDLALGVFETTDVDGFSEESISANAQIFLINRDPAIVVYHYRVNTGSWVAINPIRRNCSSSDPRQCMRDGNYDFLCYAPRGQPGVTIFISYKKNNGPLKVAYWSPGTITAPRMFGDIAPGRLG